MTSETDEQFVERMGRAIPYNSHLLKSVDLSRLCALARRGAEAADRIAQLEAALRELLEADDNLRELMPRWVSEALIEGALIRVRTAKDKARAALEERT